MNTEEMLGIYWNFESTSDTERYQDEVDGLIFYGYWNSESSEKIDKYFDTFKSIWVSENCELRLREWDDENNSDYSIEVYIKRWPSEQRWRSCVESSLRWFIDKGAILAWCGSEYCSPSLDVFGPDSTAGSIYAAFSSNTGFVCNSDLHEEYRELSEEQLIKFRNALA
jgi:hypothetical protein